MQAKFANQAVLGILLICHVSVCLGIDTTDPNQSSKYLEAVREFADNVLKYGRDTYGPKHTPLFIDGLNIHNYKPVEWISPEGERWVLSNLASQQNLFRMLVGLSTITGDPKYKQAAMEAIEYAFEHLRSPNGLLYWGGTLAYDAQADKVCGGQIHSIKYRYPYYGLMWEVNPKATKQLLEALWSAHVLDWSNLEIDRMSKINRTLDRPWVYEYQGGEVFFESWGGSFFAAGSSLFYAGAMLSKLSGEKEPLRWSKRLARRYIETRNPQTGIAGEVYTVFKTRDSAKYQFGDDFEGHDVLAGRLFPGYPKFFGEPATLAWQIRGWICALLIGELLGTDGDEFGKWALEELTAWGKVAYRKKDNSFIPMLTDGTSLEGYVCKKDGYYGAKGTVFKARQAGPIHFWAYALASRVTGDRFMWQMARSIARGNNLGDLASDPEKKSRVDEDTTCSDPYVVLGFLELHRKTNDEAFLCMAQNICDNILAHRFHKGFFAPTKKHVYARLDAIEALALLHLEGALQTGLHALPEVWPTEPFFKGSYRGREHAFDNDLIYVLTDSAEPPKSLYEAAAMGQLEQVKVLISHGVDVNERDRAIQSPLHLACKNGHKHVVELLLIHGADINVGDSYGSTALQYAVEKGHKEIAELLIAKGADVSLHTAACIGDLQRVEKFIDDGANVDADDRRGQTALHYAAKAGQIAVAKLLIANGADVNAGEWTPLQEAAYYSKEMVELLLAKGANINTGKWTALHSALDAGRFDIVELLLAKGADANIRDDKGRTPLHIAAWYAAGENNEIVKLLLSKGADINAKDNSGKTALLYAIENGHTEIVEFLRKHGAKEDKAPESSPK